MKEQGKILVCNNQIELFKKQLQYVNTDFLSFSLKYLYISHNHVKKKNQNEIVVKKINNCNNKQNTIAGEFYFPNKCAENFVLKSQIYESARV